MAISSAISSRSRIISLPKIHFHRNHVAPANLSFKLAATVPFPAYLRLPSSARLGVVACLKHENTEEEEKSTEEDVVAKSDHRKSEKAAAGVMDKGFLMAVAYFVAMTSLAKVAPIQFVFIADFGVIWKILLKIKSQYDEKKSIEEDVVAKSCLPKEAASTGAMVKKKFFKYFLMALACCVTASLAKLAHLDDLLVAVFNDVWNMLPTMKSEYEEYKWLIEVIKLVFGVWNFIRKKMKEKKKMMKKKKKNEESTSGSY